MDKNIEIIFRGEVLHTDDWLKEHSQSELLIE